MKRISLCLLLFLAIQPARALDWNAERGQQINALLDARDGFWVGTADKGLWRRDAQNGWKQFLAGNAVRCLLERDGQIWAGTARDGLQIWDGAAWKTIGVDNGLPGERVNDLALDGDNGDVWVATEGGLARWNDDGGWTTPDAPETQRQIVGVAAAGGQVWAATACDGLLHSADRGQSWTLIAGASVQPDVATGEGLPSDVLNDVAVDEQGQVWVATDLGLARSSDDGKSWFFVRGDDWRKNVEGSADALKPTDEEARVEPPGEDWVQTLAPDGAGHIWLGFRQKGAEIRDIQTAELLYATRFTPGRLPGANTNEWVRAIVPLPNGRAILGRFGGGLDAALGAELPDTNPVPAAPAKLKVPGVFPTLGAEQIALVGTAATPKEGALWNVDARTRGDWVGRYGDRVASVYEMPWERTFQRDPDAKLAVQLGWRGQGDGPYTYIAELSGTNPAVLYNPAIGTRRVDEINDGTWQSGKYPLSFDGPGLWVQAEVGAGAHRVAIYFYNHDGQGGLNAYRDYVVQLKPWSADLKDAEKAPDLARCRVSDFQKGLYASFAVSGPGKYWIKVGRHRSFVTKFSGVFIDRIGDAAPLANETSWPSLQGESYQTRPVPAAAPDENAVVRAARAAWLRLDERAARGEIVPGDWQLRHQLWRAAREAGANETLLANWRWKLALWTEEDRAEWDNAMARIEHKRAEATAKAE